MLMNDWIGTLFGTGVGMIYTVDRVVTLPANRLEMYIVV